jgi:hypothetical protein
MHVDYTSVKWILFSVLFLTVPAMLFLVQAVIFLPAIFFLAGIIVAASKMFSGKFGEPLVFIAFLGVHVLIYIGIYFGISVALAKGISMIRSSKARNIIVSILVLGLGTLTQLPVYGGGGHGPIRWGSLSSAIGKSHGPHAVLMVYIPAIVVVLLFLILRRYKSSKSTGKRQS